MIRQKALQYSLTTWQIKVCQIQTMDKSSLMESSSICKMFRHVNVIKTQFSTWRLDRISDYLQKIEVPAKSQRRQFRDAELSQNINNLLTRISKKLMYRMSKIMNQSSPVMQKKSIPSHVLAPKSTFVAKLYQKTMLPIHNSSKILHRFKVLIDHRWLLQMVTTILALCSPKIHCLHKVKVNQKMTENFTRVRFSIKCKVILGDAIAITKLLSRYKSGSNLWKSKKVQLGRDAWTGMSGCIHKKRSIILKNKKCLIYLETLIIWTFSHRSEFQVRTITKHHICSLIDKERYCRSQLLKQVNISWANVGITKIQI